MEKKCDPIVTIGITTYNLEKYISKALDSVLAQETTFDYKILIVDDASSDKTPSILLEYQSKHPDVIDVILKDTNTGSLSSSNLLFNNIKTPYLSFLDGDDYWLTTTRLQEAIDFLENNNDYTIYGGNTVLEKNGVFAGRYLKKRKSGSYTINDYINKRITLVHTSALVLRNVVYNHGVPQSYIDNETTEFNCAFRGEVIRYIEHLRVGKMYIANKDLSVYRIHEGGIWQGKSQIRRDVENIISDIVFCHLFPETAPRFYVSYINSISMFGEKYLSRYSTLDRVDREEVKVLMSVVERIDIICPFTEKEKYTMIDVFLTLLFKVNRRITIGLRTILVRRASWFRFR